MYDLQIPTPTRLKVLYERFEGKTAIELRKDYANLIDLEVLHKHYKETEKKAAGGSWEVRMWENKNSQQFITDFCFWFCDKYAQKFHELKRFARAQEIQLVNFCHNIPELESSFVGHFADFGQKCEFSLDGGNIFRTSYLVFPFTPIAPFGSKEQIAATGKTIEFFVSFFTPIKAELQ